MSEVAPLTADTFEWWADLINECISELDLLPGVALGEGVGDEVLRLSMNA